jgi:16S rRNA (adenine1518-N6/adenine1519-N6)-dimethyltransferase
MASGKRVNVASTRARISSRGRAKPKLGQNFLVSRPAAERIVAALGDTSHATVVEIGPGRGILTDLLAERTRRLIGVELDRVLAAQLRMRYARQPNVEIIEGDVLSIDLGNVLGPRPMFPLGGLTHQEVPQKAWIIGNLPYYITSDILLRLFEFYYALEKIVVMVQREVADRIVARPGTRDYGLLSATTQLYAKVEKLFTLPPGAFNPSPKVHSAVVRMNVAPQAQRLGVQINEFIEFLKLSFGQKRKTLVNNLRTRYNEDPIRSALRQARVRADVRAEAVPLEKAAAIFKALSVESSANSKSR